MVSYWSSWSRKDACGFTVALLTTPLGKLWREVDAITNPLFLSFAMRSYSDFVAAVARLPERDRRTALAALRKVNRAKHDRLRAAWADAVADRSLGDLGSVA